MSLSRRISVVLQHLSVANGAIEAGGLFTRESIVREVANKSLLVEDGAVATEEAPLGGAGHHPVVVLDGQADVEDLRGAPLLIFQFFAIFISGFKHKIAVLQI